MSDLALIIDALIYKLGVGLRRDTDTPASVRSEEELANEEEGSEPAFDGAALAKICRGKINRLFKRMEGQLALAAERKKSVIPQIIQLAAVLGVVEYLRNRESDFEWLPRNEELVDVNRAWEFFESAARYLYGSSCLAEVAFEENAGNFDELTASRGLLTWLALDCGMDVRSVLGDLADEPEDVRERVEEVGYFVPVVMDCVADKLATELLTKVTAEKTGGGGSALSAMKETAEYHLGWAYSLVSVRPIESSAIRLGDIVRPRLKPGSSPGVVVEVQGTKAGILDLDTRETRAFVSSYLSRVGGIPPGDK